MVIKLPVKQTCQELLASGFCCKRAPVAGSRFCSLHKKSEQIRVRDDREGYTVDIPTPLRESYNAIRNDPDALSLSQDIYLLRSRIEQLLGRLSDDGLEGKLEMMAEQKELLQMAIESGEVDLLVNAGKAMLQAMEQLPPDSYIWSEIRLTQEAMRKMVDTEGRRVKNMHLLLTMEEATRNEQFWIAAVRKCCPPNIQEAIAAELRSAAARR